MPVIPRFNREFIVGYITGFQRIIIYPVVTVQDANDPSYSDTIEKAAFNMFKRDYEGSEYVTYFKQPCEIVVVLA